MDRPYSRREPSETQIAVLIDYENVGLGSIQSLLDQVSDVGRIIVKRAYADWAVAANKRDQLLELGIEAIHNPRLASAGKNSSDIRLVIDATDLLYSSPVDTFVIVSSDSDFVPLVSKLRAAGKTVIGAGRSAVASRTLITACDRYIYLDTPDESAKTRDPTLREQAEPLLVRAVNVSVDSQGQVRGARLHQTMIRLDPSFDFRALGYKTFTQFVTSSKKVKVHREGDQGDVIVELASTQDRTPRSIQSSPKSGPIRLPSSTSQDNMSVEEADINGKAKVSLSSRVAGILPLFGAKSKPKETPAEAKPDPAAWDLKVDEAWSKRKGAVLPGTWAASEAARVLEASKLSVSQYRTLQALLDASEYLRSRWYRNGNAIVRR